MTQQAPPPITPPIPQPESDFYWEKCKEHQLWLRHCKACNNTYFYPRDICPGCFSRDTDWIQSSGKAILHAFAIVYRAPVPAFRGKEPFVTAIVELEGGARMPTNILDCEADPEHIKIGMALQVTFDDLDDKISLPKFRPA